MGIAIWGYYGSNYGDDIMLEVILNYLDKKFIQIKLVDLYSGKLSYNLGTKYKNVEVVDFKNLPKKDKIKEIKRLSKYSINIWGGGTIFTDVDGDGNFRFFSLIKLLGGKIGYLGIGLGTLTRQSMILKTKFLLKISSLIVFRDEKSITRAKEMKIKNAYKVEDLSYLFFEKFNQFSNQVTNKENKKYILVTWRNLNGYLAFKDELTLMDKVAENIKKLVEENDYEEVILSALDTNFDVESCRYLYSKLLSKDIKTTFDIDSSIQNITNLIKNASFHFSGRLHGSIASEFFGTPTLSLSYSPKIEYFYNSIGATNFINIYQDKIELRKIEEVIMYKNSKVSILESKIEKSAENFRYLEQFLTN